MSSRKRVSAVEGMAGLSISALTLNQGLANSAPLDPPPCPNGSCQGGPGGPGGPHSPQAPETTAPPQTSAAPATTAAPQTTEQQSPQTTAPH